MKIIAVNTNNDFWFDIINEHEFDSDVTLYKDDLVRLRDVINKSLKEFETTGKITEFDEFH